MRHLERKISSLWSYFQAVQLTATGQLCELSPVLEQALVMQLSMSHCRCSHVNNSIKTHWFTKLSFSGICTLVCQGLPIQDEQMCM